MELVQRLQEEVDRLRAAGAGDGQLPQQRIMDPGCGMPGYGGDVFVGRARLNLRDCVLQRNAYRTLPLVVHRPEHDIGTTLTVQVFRANDEAEVKELPDIQTALDMHRGKRFDFCVGVLYAEGIPETHTARVFCRYVFQQKEEKVMQTEDRRDTTAPTWDFLKRFAWSTFDDELGQVVLGELNRQPGHGVPLS